MKIIFHGHSFVEIENDGNSILIDPFIKGNILCDVSLEEICEKNIRLIGITHGHMDHIGNTIDIVKKTGAQVVATYEVVQYLLSEYKDINVFSMHIGGYKNFEDLCGIKFVNAVHGNGVGPQLLGGKAAGIIVFLNDLKIYHAGDTALTYDMKLLEEMKIDLSFLPIGDNFTMGIKDAVKAVEFIKPKVVVPIHYDTFDTIKQDVMAFKTSVDMQNIAYCNILNPGEYIKY